MRTTLTLDPDVAQLLKSEAHRLRKPFKQVVNDAIRRGLSPGMSARRTRYRVRAHRTTLRPGIDLAGFNQLVDELDDELILARAREES